MRSTGGDERSPGSWKNSKWMLPMGLFATLLLTLQGCGDAGEETRADGIASPRAHEVVHALDAADREAPNIIIIMADDLGYGDLGSYGGRSIRTPNIDSLAAEGVRFTDFHASDSVCTPSRAGLLTGRYAKRMGLDFPLQSEVNSLSQRAVIQFGYQAGKLGLVDLATEGGPRGLPADEITLAEALAVAGYATGMVGKWHLGDFATSPQFNPRRHGFDSYFGVPHSNDMQPFPLYRDEEQLQAEVADQSELTGLYTEEAIRFIEASREGPFFLYFAHTFPHRPLHASKKFRGHSKAGLYGDAVEEIDWSVGELIRTLERNGLRENTLIVFTSDNGPWYQGSAGGLRGRKGQSYEGGYRVPFIARWPGHIPASSVSTELAMNIDLLPTCLALAGLSLPEDRVIDGKNIQELLTSPGNPGPHDVLYFYHHGQLEGVRKGKWKYFQSINHYVWPLPVNKQLGGLTPYTKGLLPLLFNLEIDPDESYDVADKYPIVAERLARRMASWQAEMAATRTPGG